MFAFSFFYKDTHNAEMSTEAVLIPEEQDRIITREEEPAELSSLSVSPAVNSPTTNGNSVTNNGNDIQMTDRNMLVEESTKDERIDAILTSPVVTINGDVTTADVSTPGLDGGCSPTEGK